MTHSHDRWSAALFIRNIEHEHSCTSDRRKKCTMTHRYDSSCEHLRGTECARKMHDKEWLLFDQGWNEERVLASRIYSSGLPGQWPSMKIYPDHPSRILEIVAKNCCKPPNQVATRFSSKLNKICYFMWSDWSTNESHHQNILRCAFDGRLSDRNFPLSDWTRPRTNQNQSENSLQW